MLKVSLIPDTNALMSNLPLIRDIMNYPFPITCTLNIARVVIQELDKLKTSKKEAREAVAYLASIALSIRTEIEGYVDDRKMAVEILGSTVISEQNNDDKILNYIFKQENPVFLTNDTAFALKCHSFNIFVIMPRHNSSDFVILKILELFGIPMTEAVPVSAPAIKPVATAKPKTPSPVKAAKKVGKVAVTTQVNTADMEIIENGLTQFIIPIIHQILYREVGEQYALLFIGRKLDLRFYLSLVIQNFYIFKPYLPKGTISIIQEFFSATKKKDSVKMRKEGEAIYAIFRNITSG